MMRSLYKVASGQKKGGQSLSESDKLSVNYHNLFDFPLTFAELIRWQPSENILLNKGKDTVIYQSGYYFLEGKTGLVYKRSLRERISVKKMEIAKRTANILGLIPGVKMVAVTGSLAMGNSSDESDIDLFVITKKGTLWRTRAFVHLVILLSGIKKRNPKDKVQKDKLCLNMWMDESDLLWKKRDRNIYTAHEIAQILPLVNKGGAYEKFLAKNAWILEFWPNAVKMANHKLKIADRPRKTNIVEELAFKVQYLYMKNKISREVVTPTRAIFHPQDWGKIVISRLGY